MGLDITYYKNISKIECEFDEDGEPLLDGDAWFQAYTNPEFPGRADEIEDGAVYAFEDSGKFRAGSYSGYNAWREALAKMTGYPALGSETGHQHSEGAWAATEGPFWELICFSDCEGTIGARVSAKLADDFAAFQDKVDADSYFAELYGLWRTAFETAANNGAVDFH